MNGEKLRIVLDAAEYVAINTFVGKGEATWRGSRGHEYRIDYIGVLEKDMTAVTDCYVERNVDIACADREDHF